MPRLLLLLMAMVLASPASADRKKTAPTIAIGPPGQMNTLDRVRLVLTTDTRETRAVLTLTMSKLDRIDRNRWSVRDPWARIAVTMPANARVVGLAASVGARPRRVAQINVTCAVSGDCSVRHTWQRFVGHSSKDRDTALLQYGYASDGIGHYDVYVSPMAVGTPATVELEIEMDPVRELAIKSGHAVNDFSVEIDGAAQTVTPLVAKYKPQRVSIPKPKPAVVAKPKPADDTDELIARRAADRDNALLVEPPSTPPATTP